MILVIGARDFADSNLVLGWLAQSDESAINFDASNYAGNLENPASNPTLTRHIFSKGNAGNFSIIEVKMEGNPGLFASSFTARFL